MIATWLAGVLAAVGLGAVFPVASALRAELGLTLGAAAWATSSIAAVSAVLGVPAGCWIRRFGAGRALPLGLFIMSVAAAASALAGSWGMLLASRVVEGLGYLLVFIAGSIVLTRLTEGGMRAAALALWGTCVPTGLAIAAAAGGALAQEWTWQRWLGLTAAGPAMMAGLLAVILPPVPAAAVARSRHRPLRSWNRALVLAGSYGSLALISVAVVALLPAFLTERRQVTSAVAGSAVAVVSLASAVGGLLASWLLRRGTALIVLVPLGVLMPLAAFPAFSTGVPLGAGVAAAIVVLLVNGLLISAVFAAVPGVVSRPRDVDVAGGLLAQLGGLGMLIGPPLFGGGIAAAGWAAVGAETLAFTGLATVLLLIIARGIRRPGTRRPRGTAVAGATALSAHRTAGTQPSATPPERQRAGGDGTKH